jgi:outer membrane biosynthesis protein TonB
VTPRRFPDDTFGLAPLLTDVIDSAWFESKTVNKSLTSELFVTGESLQEAGTGRNQGAPIPTPVRFPGEDGGRSLAEVAQRDLDAALQLLADRAQYITGASGAAIALRRIGMKDLQCRASTGSNAPELGALLSTEFGLSGESVRTGRALRCDDAERDARVNQEVCRKMGIASVVVMPVVNDDEVLGVFELFSGKAHAFGERDLSAVRRLSEMVEIAVRLAEAAQSLPEKLKNAQETVPAAAAVAAPPAAPLAPTVVPAPAETKEQILDIDIPEPPAVKTAEPAKAAPEAPEVKAPQKQAEIPTAVTDKVPQTVLAAQPAKEPAKPAEPVGEKKALFWSAADSPAEGGKVEADQSNVPPVLRSLRKCEACGFPVSAGRQLCVECEEKSWKGHLKR